GHVTGVQTCALPILAGRRQPLGTFTLFNFSAKFDPVPSMLVQNHRSVVNDFFGVTTSFTRSDLKPGDVILAEEPGAPWVKYIHRSEERRVGKESERR